MSKSPEVEAWFAALDHPLKSTMLRVREIVLNADSRIDECIKWKTPTFTFQGNLASFNPRSKALVSLMFHTGAMIPGEHPLLEGDGSTARYMQIADIQDAESAKSALRSLVQEWCNWKSKA